MKSRNRAAERSWTFERARADARPPGRRRGAGGARRPSHVDAPAGLITPEIRDSITRHKPELLAMLAADPAEYENWAPLDVPGAWTDRLGVIAAVEDLADEGMRPSRSPGPSA